MASPGLHDAQVLAAKLMLKFFRYDKDQHILGQEMFNKTNLLDCAAVHLKILYVGVPRADTKFEFFTGIAGKSGFTYKVNDARKCVLPQGIRRLLDRNNSIFFEFVRNLD